MLPLRITTVCWSPCLETWPPIGVGQAQSSSALADNRNDWQFGPAVQGFFPVRGSGGAVGPSFQWNILNYGRILNNVRLQDARLQELLTVYQNTVLTAAQDVENGLVTFLRAQQRAQFQAASVADAEEAVKIALKNQWPAGLID